MTFYRGRTQGDERPKGGGKYNERSVGAEICTFLPVGQDRRLFGYMRTSEVKLARIVPGAEGEALKGVDVVFLARSLGTKRQVVVGWYRKATIFRYPRRASQLNRAAASAGIKNGISYCIETTADDAVLLPSVMRTLPVPHRKGATGTSNVWYPLERDGKAKKAAWVRPIEQFIASYEGPNLLVDPDVEGENLSASSLESARVEAQGFQPDSRVRKAIEEYSLKRAESWLKKKEMKGCAIQRSGRPHDLIARKGRKRLYVEVKGTQSDAKEIVLTANEVTFARKHSESMRLFVLHSVKLRWKGKKPIASGGAEFVVKPWLPVKTLLEPVQYWYRLSEHGQG
jgi:hypothetical protein